MVAPAGTEEETPMELCYLITSVRPQAMIHEMVQLARMSPCLPTIVRTALLEGLIPGKGPLGIGL